MGPAIMRLDAIQEPNARKRCRLKMPHSMERFHVGSRRSSVLWLALLVAGVGWQGTARAFLVKLLPAHCTPAPSGATPQIDPAVVLTIGTSGIDINGSPVEERNLDGLVGEVYRTRIDKTLFVTATHEVSYERLVSIVASLKRRPENIVLLSAKSKSELLTHLRLLDCYYHF